MQIPTRRQVGRGTEEGDTILAIDLTQAILIRAHHANDLAAKANEGKEAKMFEEMVPEWCRDFADLFEKKNFDKLPEPRTWDHAIELTPTQTPTLTARSTLSIIMNKPSSTHSWTKTFQVDEFDHRSHLWLRHSSSSKRRMQAMTCARLSQAQRDDD